MNTATHNMHLPSPQDCLSPERPWPGLAAYTEADRAYFFGRDTEAEDLARRIRREHLTVLFGQSGLGKTSLLKAGLFPRLRASDLQPIYLRLDYTAQARPLGEQVLAAISAVIQREALDAPLPQTGEGLWAYFHRRDLEWWSPRNRLLTPVLVFDQFEEIFTLGRSHLQASQTFLDELADLIENRVPEQATEQAVLDGQDNSRVFGKLLLSFREDFLPDFEALKGRIHSLFLNRVRLERLSGEAACSVLQESGGHLLAAGLAQDIVRFVAAEKKPRPLPELTVEPALLSVVCRELNERRISRHAERIGADMLELGQHEILRDLVGRALTDQPAALVEELEEHLLTDGGHRAQYPLQDLIQRAGVGTEAIYALVTQRILRVEPRGEVEWVELTHDLLAPVVRENRDRRRAALELERNRRKMRRIWAFAGAMVVLVVVMAGLSWQMFRAQEAARTSLAEADRQKLQAEQEKAKAEQARNAALRAEADAREQREIALQGREAALAAQAKTAEALNVAVAAEARARDAVKEARLQQQEAERLQVSGLMDLAMLGFYKKYDTWAKIVGSSASAGQIHDRTLSAARTNILHEYFSKMGFETDKTQIAGFDLLPQSHLINLQARKPVYSLMELELAGPAKFLILDDLHEPARYFCALATPNEFPIFKRFVGTPGFPWEMQCKFMEALHLAAKGRTVEAESHLLEAASLGVLQDWSGDGFGIGGRLNSIAFFKYLASQWGIPASKKNADNSKEASRDPTWRERANLVRNIYLLQKTLQGLIGRSRILTTDWDAKKDTRSLAFLRINDVLAKRFGFSVDEATLKEAKQKGSPSDRLQFVIGAVPKNLGQAAMEELRLPADWNVYAGWYERKLAAEAGPAYFDTSFLREFLDEKWVAETLAEWLKQEPNSSWANHIEAERLLLTTEASESTTKIDAHLALAASNADAAADTVHWAAFRRYRSKGYLDAISLYDRAARLNPSDADAQMMSVLAHIELGEVVTTAMAIRMESAVAIAKARNARPADLAEVILGEAVTRLEAGRPPTNNAELVLAFRESKQCDLAYFERRNWREKMLQLLKKHRAQVCIPE